MVRIAVQDRASDPPIRPRLQGAIEAVERFLGASQATVGTGQAGQVADRCRPPIDGIAEVRLRVGQQPGQRPDVLVVVPDDLGQWRRRAAAQEVEVQAGDLPAVDIRSAVHPEQLDLDRPEARIGQAVAEDPPDEREQVEVAGVRRRSASAHPIAGDEQRPVEAAAVVGDQPGVRRDRRGEGVEQGGLLGVIRQEELDLAEPVAGP